MRLKSKASEIRKAIRAGEKPKDIAARLGVKINKIYTTKWEMKKTAALKRKISSPKKIAITKSEADLAKKLGVPVNIYAKEKLKAESIKETPLANFVLQELVNLEHQIDRLNTIRSFLSLRLQQLEQNGE